MRDAAAAAAATHHLLLGHGLAVQALRAVTPDSPVGITLDMHPVQVLGDQRPGCPRAGAADHRRGAERPVPRAAAAGQLPGPGQAAPAAAGVGHRRGRHGDDQPAPRFPRRQLLQPRSTCAPVTPTDLRRNEEPARCAVPGVVEYRPGWLERTPMGWLVDADGLYDLLLRLSKEAPGLPLYVTENGCAAEDYVNPRWRGERLRAGLAICTSTWRPPRGPSTTGPAWPGYFVWSLLDNFEWALGLPEAFRHRLRRFRNPAPDSQVKRPVLLRRGTRQRRAAAEPREAAGRVTAAAIP